MAVGNKLGVMIKSKGLTQKEVAERAGINPQTLNNLITRDSARADIQVFMKICKALDVSLDVFADDALEEFYSDHPDAPRVSIEKERPAMTSRQTRIVKLFDKLTTEQQDNIIGRAELLVEQNEEEYRKEDCG